MEMYITKNHKSIRLTDEELTEADKRQLKRQRFAMVRMLQRQESKDLQQYELEHKNGYCPKCHMLLPLSGKCDNCD